MNLLGYLRTIRDTYLQLTVGEESQDKFKTALANELRRQSDSIPFFIFLSFLSLLFVSSGFLFLILGVLNSNFLTPVIFIDSQLIAGGILFVTGVVCGFISHNYFSNIIRKVSTLREATKNTFSISNIFQPIFDQISKEQALFLEQHGQQQRPKTEEEKTFDRQYRESSLEYH